MSNKYKFLNPEGIYFVTSTTVQLVNVFTRPVYKDMLIESLEFCQKKKGLNLHTFCIMTNHDDFIFSCKGTNSFSDIIRDYKKFTSVKLIELIQQNQKEAGKIGYYGFSVLQEEQIPIINIFKCGNKIITP